MFVIFREVERSWEKVILRVTIRLVAFLVVAPLPLRQRACELFRGREMPSLDPFLEGCLKSKQKLLVSIAV